MNIYLSDFMIEKFIGEFCFIFLLEDLGMCTLLNSCFLENKTEAAASMCYPASLLVGSFLPCPYTFAKTKLG